ncbi:hypothetical protein RvY_07810 [Ramazzottius varieornatus]|uniref:Uncharacterized protein n=1 Tax=Ramazzottius varieornatus TaxID=947166 RepID=A0A1D1V3S1_RAMVA|nr:hypothetical protein RvY_07810 [Ramazzottius varieornatus]
MRRSRFGSPEGPSREVSWEDERAISRLATSTLSASYSRTTVTSPTSQRPSMTISVGGSWTMFVLADQICQASGHKIVNFTA